MWDLGHGDLGSAGNTVTLKGPKGLFQSKQFFDSLKNLPSAARKAEASQKFHTRQIFPESPANICCVLVSI